MIPRNNADLILLRKFCSHQEILMLHRDNYRAEKSNKDTTRKLNV